MLKKLPISFVTIKRFFATRNIFFDLIIRVLNINSFHGDEPNNTYLLKVKQIRNKSLFNDKFHLMFD